MEEPVVVQHRKQIVELATRGRIPTLISPAWVDAGALIAYGTSLTEGMRRMATYADRILKGAKPADLPVEQASKDELVLNLKTAKALGLTIPPSLLLRAGQSDRIARAGPRPGAAPAGALVRVVAFR